MRRTTLFSVVLLLMFVGAGSAQAATVTVETQDNMFVPADAKVQAGDTVTFKNTGQAPHNAQSPDRKVFIDVINPGESKDVVVSEGGTISYVCTFHQALGMKGTITVEGAAGAAPAGAAGTPSPGASPGATPAAGAAPSPGASPGATPAAGGASPSPGATPSPGASPGEEEGTPGVEEEPPLESPVTEKYLPPIGAAIFVLMLLGLGAPFKQHLKPILRSAPPTYEPAPVGAPASIASPVTVAAPAAAVATAPPPAAPAPAAPAPAAPAAPAGPALDPDQVYKAVLAEETGKGTDPRVAEARAKAAQMRTQEAQATTAAAPAAEAPAPAAEAAAPAEAPAPAAEAAAPEAAAPEAAPAAEAAPEAAAPEAAPPAAPAGKAMSDEEAAEIRKKVYEEEMAKGSDPRVAEGRAKSAELRAKKGTYQPK